jgi:hypothetical protein
MAEAVEVKVAVRMDLTRLLLIAVRAAAAVT